jgi:hypothetical protein
LKASTVRLECRALYQHAPEEPQVLGGELERRAIEPEVLQPVVGHAQARFPLDGTHDGLTVRADAGRRVPTELDVLAPAHRETGNEVRETPWCFEHGDGVAPVDRRCDDGSRRSKVDPYAHAAARLQVSVRRTLFNIYLVSCSKWCSVGQRRADPA